ncbi:MAG: LysR family transcriptional regulator [Nitratireductor sp.]
MGVFMEVCRTGSFRQAAVVLSLTPSAVTHHVRKLEEMLGIALYRREIGRFELTAEGREVANRFRDPLSHLEYEFQQTALAGKNRSRTVKLTFASGVGTRAFYAFLARYSRENPAMILELVVKDEREDIDASGNDIAIRIGWPQTQGTGKTIFLRNTRSLICATDEYCQEQSIRLFADLERATWIYMRGLPFPIRFERNGRLIELDPRNVVYVNASNIAYDLVYNSVGISTLLDFVVEDDGGFEKVNVLFPDYQLPERQLFLAIRENRRNDPEVLRLIDALVAHFRR